MRRRQIISLTVALMMMALLAACGPAASAPEAAAPADEAAPAATTAPAEESTAADEATASESDGETAAGRTFVVVPGESTASYIVNEEFFADALSKLGIQAGKTVVTGSTGDVEGSLTIDLENAALSDGIITVNLSTLTSDQSRRDNWVQERDPQFGRFSTAQFVPTGVENAPASYTEGEETTFQLTGDLSVREVTIPATFNVTAKVEGDTLTGVAEANMNISDFGINPPNFANTLSVEDPFTIRVELTATAQ